MPKLVRTLAVAKLKGSWFKVMKAHDFDKFPCCLVRTQARGWLDSGNFLEVKAMDFEDTMGEGCG